MRMVRSMVVALVAFAWVACAANADSVAWFRNESVPVAPAGGGPGAPSTRLDLTCNSAAAGSCSWVVTLQVTSNSTLSGWSANLSTAAGNGVSATGSAFALAGNGGIANNMVTTAGTIGGAGTGGSGASLLTNGAGYTLTPANPPSNINLITFTLNKTYNLNESSVADIFFKTNAADAIVWTDNDTGNYMHGSVGPNGAVDLAEGTSLPLAVIRITTTPEPASIGLLVIGAAALLRRKVAR